MAPDQAGMHIQRLVLAAREPLGLRQAPPEEHSHTAPLLFPSDCSAFRTPKIAPDQAGIHIQRLVLATHEHNGI